MKQFAHAWSNAMPHTASVLTVGRFRRCHVLQIVLRRSQNAQTERDVLCRDAGESKAVCCDRSFNGGVLQIPAFSGQCNDELSPVIGRALARHQAAYQQLPHGTDHRSARHSGLAGQFGLSEPVGFPQRPQGIPFADAQTQSCNPVGQVSLYQSMRLPQIVPKTA